MKPETLEWIQKAEGDYQVANNESKSKNPVHDAICFHAQQCVEKYLKAWLVENNWSFPRTHDLITFYDLCIDVISELKPHRTSLAYLTTFAIAFRYPGEQTTKTDTNDSVKTMETLRALLKWRLGVSKS